VNALPHMMPDKEKGLTFGRWFSDGTDPLKTVKWETRTAQLTDAGGKVIFEQKGVVVPMVWSQTATNIVASKYFYGKNGRPDREFGVDQMIQRVTKTITESGREQGYFRTVEDAQIFRDELMVILLQQYAAFNSPVYFNVGLHELDKESKGTNWHWKGQDGTFGENSVVYGVVGYTRPQCSACFINSVEDSMEGIMGLAKTEAMLFKWGSGTGSNLSSLRSSKETVSGGGVASGPLSFMKGFDAFAGVIKSGGKTRRAAKMVILNVDHPDVEEFITCKQREEKKAYALMAMGYDGSGPDSEAYSSIFYQNANNSVRVSDDFMECVVQKTSEPAEWPLKAVTDGRTVDTVEAGGLFRLIAKATHECGDPGMQFDDTVNQWHTCPNSGRINASNPCSEYMFLDDSACNLASLNLLKFLKPDGTFDTNSFRVAIDILITAQDILIDLSGYPTEKIAKNSHDYRPLGLGYANLGALLMALGLPYDSDGGRAYAACLTSIMTGEAYNQSGLMARHLDSIPAANSIEKPFRDPHYGAFPGYRLNREPMTSVIKKHAQAAIGIPVIPDQVPGDLLLDAEHIWSNALTWAEGPGFRNAQVTVLAPTGTIGFMMDCDTTGIEPMLALVAFKKLVGGGYMKLTNRIVVDALTRLGYSQEEVDYLDKYVQAHGSLESSTLKPEHLAIFDTALKSQEGKRFIRWEGHIRMMAAAQPFLSGAISKTINMPEEATVEVIEQAYIEAWKRNLKAVAIYRDGSKKNQVLTTKKDKKADLDKECEAFFKSGDPDRPAAIEVNPNSPPKAIRNRLPDERMAVAHKFNIANHEGYLHVGLYPDGQPGEIFITMAKEGSTISGLMDSFALVVSIALQHGVPLQVLIDKLSHTRFEPSGWTHNSKIGYAKSVMDYVARYLEYRFLGQNQLLFSAGSALLASDLGKEEVADKSKTNEPQSITGVMEMGDAPPCATCGAIMVRNGSCFKCMECGGTSGCS